MVRSPDQRSFDVGAVRAGCRITVLLAISGLAYTLSHPEEPHRWALVAIMVVAGLDGVVMGRVMPHPRVLAAGRLPHVLMAWNLIHVVAIATCAALDGGLSSPFVAMFFVSIVFAALTLPSVSLLVVAFADAVALFVVGAEFGGDQLLAIYVPCVFIIGLLSATIAGELHRRIAAVEAAQAETIEKLARAVEFRDASTGGHIDRMAAYARILAERLGLPDAECELIFRAGPLHDVGKIGVPDAILLKPGPLTDAERAVMERHAQAGHDLLRDSHSELLQLGAVIALHHHERWDGAGYPNRLRAEEIPLAARIVAVADVFDALTTDRVYRPAMPFEDAVAIVRNGRGSHFDPLVVDAFLAALDEFARVSLGLQERARRNPRGEAAELPPREDRPVGAER
ncbi:MAG: Response regulator [Solirubrobacterales bacterium]|nr:Response regulator [Solirubrobacterales bacterium]